MYVYIIYSKSLDRFYVGQTANIDDRLTEHNAGKGKFTSKGAPWILIHFFETVTRSEAMLLEKKIKSRGIKRYLQDNAIL
jgi:putative endonuclease